MKRIIALSCLCALAFGCQRIEPRSGTWVIANDEVLEDSCQLPGVAPTDGDFTVFEQDDGKLIIDPEDGTDPFVCTLDGASFECPERLSAQQSVGGFDAEVIVHGRAEGAFDNNRSASGVQHGRIECKGSDCDALAAAQGTSVPCEMSVSFEATFRD